MSRETTVIIRKQLVENPPRKGLITITSDIFETKLKMHDQPFKLELSTTNRRNSLPPPLPPDEETVTCRVIRARNKRRSGVNNYTAIGSIGEPIIH